MKAVFALLSLVVACVSFYIVQAKEGFDYLLYLGIAGVIGVLIFGGMFMAGRVNKDGNIHIGD